ncbi:MFS transporter [Herbaspirillum robiniae]|uniref:MFS transporter n=2 Tax=Herbaspirillum robiniae TaxID=2014887 RepID=A0ABX2LTB0_9BURK|nr:MFS transporter [Herbaspirillum robiniae]
MAHPGAHAGRFDVYRRISWRIMPFIVLCYLCAYLDRVNVGFAKLQMMNDLQFSDAIYGLGAGIFFIGYFIFEVPSNLIMHKVGARVWIARIMITWAVISAATLFVQTPTQFYVARFLLGVAEAGFSPGIMLYLTYWFPARKRGFALGFYYIAIPLAGVVGGPLSGWILDAFSQSAVMRGWQWLFLIEAIPSLVAGIAVLFLMVDKPEQAQWLSSDEKRQVIEEIRREDSAKTTHESSASFLRDSRLWKLCLVYFCQIIGLYGVSFWLPSIIKGSGITDNTTIGWLSAIPYLVAIPAIIITGITADRYRSRRMHFSVALVIGAIGLAFSGYIGRDPTLAVIGLSVGTAGTLSALSLFWGIPSAFLAGTSAAAGIATINCVGNLAGFVSPYMVGWLNDATGNVKIGLYAVGAFMVLGAILVRMISAKFADQ